VRWRKLGPADYKVMPWKNGAGSTTELLIDPPGATLEAFRWRLSMAAVAASGPFSAFPGIDRTLLLLEGNGLELDYGSAGHARLPGSLVPASFSGDWKTYGRLLDGPCRDFNVMSDRTRVRHSVSVLRPGPEPLAMPQAPILLLYCAQGRLRAEMPGGSEDLESGELLQCDDGVGGSVSARGTTPGTALITIALDPIGQG
jgi:environmental stress-induced protein Ves